MKNIYLLATDKASRLHLWTDENGTRPALCELEYSHTRNTRHIYITNDEEIKQGDWCINLNSLYNHKELCRIDNQLELERYAKKTSNKCKKIILTTDADLIKDGVQTIPDEFLEWFVKNPSCEYVEIFNNWNYNDKGFIDHSGYKIITQNEEPNQDIIMELQKDPLLKDFDNQVNKKISFLKQKQETLEEVAKKSAIEHFEKGNSYYILGFENGAKYQLEQSFKLMSEYANYYEQCYSERPTKTPLQPSLWFEKFKNK